MTNNPSSYPSEGYFSVENSSADDLSESAASRLSRNGGLARTRPQRARSQRAVRNDRILSEAALVELNLHGFDGLQIGAVAKRAGLSSGAAYNRFENVAEMAISLWEEALRDQAFKLFDLVVELGHQAFYAPLNPELISEATQPSPAWRGALELLLVARRVEELNEVITADLQAWQSRNGFELEDDPILYCRAISSLSPLIGLSMMAMLPRPVLLPVEDVLRIHQGILDSPWQYSELPPPPAEFSAVSDDDLVVATGDPVVDVLITAAGQVTANSGFARSTVSRIARLAGFTTSAIYERWANKDALIMDTVTTMLTQHLLITGQSNSAAVRDPRFRMLIPLVISQSLSPGRTLRRRFRQEMTLAGIHNIEIGNVVSQACELGVLEIKKTVAPLPDERAANPNLIAGYIRSSVAGRDLLSSLDADLQRADFRPYTDYLLDCALELKD